MSFFRLLDYPPVWLVACMAAARGLADYASIFSFGGDLGGLDVRVEQAVGALFVLDGLALMAWAAVAMFRAKTTIVPRRDVSALVTDGPFRFSRNPIYLGDALILMGWCIAQGAVSAFITVPLFVWIITQRFIRPEEAELRAKFPDDFAAWSAKTRRWV